MPSRNPRAYLAFLFLVLTSVVTSGAATPQPPSGTLAVSATTLDFGSQALGTRGAPLTLTVQNTGIASITVGAMAVLGADATQFLVLSNGCFRTQLASGGTCDAKFAFGPTHGGASTATLTVYDVDAINALPVTLTGNGTGTLTINTPAYEVVDLASPAYGLYGPNFGPNRVQLNNRGQIAGHLVYKERCLVPGDEDGLNTIYRRAFLLDMNTGSLSIAAPLPGVQLPDDPVNLQRCSPTIEFIGVNNSGQIAGAADGVNVNCFPGGLCLRQVLYSEGVLHEVQDLITDGTVLPPNIGTCAVSGPGGINDSGQIFMNCWGPALMFDQGSIVDLGPFVPGTESFFNFDTAQPVFVSPLGLTLSIRMGLNSYIGQGAASGSLFGNLESAIFQKGVVFGLGFPAPPMGLGRYSLTKINAAGQGVGPARPVGAQCPLLLWDRIRGARDVVSLVPSLAGRMSHACGDNHSINDAGEILADILDPDSSHHYYLLRPVVATPAGSNVVVQSGQVVLTFSLVSTAGTTAAKLIDASTAGQVSGGFSVSDSIAYEISTTATFAGPITIGLTVPAPISEEEFNDLRILHSTGGQLVDVTTDAPARNYDTLTIYAVTTSLSPFYLSRRGSARVNPLFDQTRAYKSGSTVPIKLQLLNASGSNISAPPLPLKVRSLLRLSDSTASTVVDSGNSNADRGFRYDASIGGTGGYIFNLSTKGLAQGTYSLSFYAGQDRRYAYSIRFQVR